MKTKRYIIAILSTLLTLISPLVFLPIVAWYKKTFEISYSLEGYQMLMVCISLIMLTVTVINWIAALRNKSVEDLLK